MRNNLSSFFLIMSFCFSLQAQPLFPIKLDKKWGLMDSDGSIILPPKYNAIGEFKKFGYAVMQRDGGVGLLNLEGREIVKPIYEDLKVLDSTLVSVMRSGFWEVINLKGEIVLKHGFEKVEVLDKRFLSFSNNGKWGIVSVNGQIIIEPEFETISIYKENYFLIEEGGKSGLLHLNGKEILPQIAEEILVYNNNLIFYKKNRKWGAVNQLGASVLSNNFSNFSKISDNFLKLISNRKVYLFSIYLNEIINSGDFETYYAFNEDYVICKRFRLLGLMDECGELILKPQYNEIQAYADNLFRVNLAGKWGVVNIADDSVIDFQYDYIAPMKDNYCVVIKNKKLGVANFTGEVVVPTVYDKVILEKQRAKAYQNGALKVFNFTAKGGLKNVNEFEDFFVLNIGKTDNLRRLAPQTTDNQYILENFEWFYSPRHDKWGLRRLDDGTIQIEPSFDEVRVQQELGLTLVGIEQFNYYDFDRTSYRFEMAYGLVNNQVGLLVHEVDLLDLRLDDYDKGLPMARCVFNNGRHGLINRIGKVILKNYSFIGEFNNGLARMSMKGKLSGSLNEKVRKTGHLRSYLDGMIAPTWMVDFTIHDREFDKDAALTCQGCAWGYIDTSGQTIIPAQYTFATDFVNDVGIVECDKKWGMVSRNAEQLIPCDYDGVTFMENTENKMIRIYKHSEKYGLINTAGELCVDLKYDEIGSFSEGRLAVKQNGFWGFVDKNGLEIIPPRFNLIRDFSNGLAAVKLGSKWGYIDKLGNVEIDFKYSRAGNFVEGLAFAKMESQPFGYIDPKGNWAIQPQFFNANDFNPLGVARIKEIAGDYVRTGVINRSGEIIVKPKLLSIKSFDENGLAIVAYSSRPMKYGLMNLDGDIITNTPFREIGRFKEGFAKVKTDKGFGYINTAGKVVITPRFSKAGDFSEGRAVVRVDGKFGYINTKGNLIIPATYSRGLDFIDGRAIVFKGNRRAGLIDLEGNVLIEPSINQIITFSKGRGLVRSEKFDFIFITETGQHFDDDYERANLSKSGVAVVKTGGRWGIINQKGIEIIPPKYDMIEDFQDGYAKVLVRGFNGLSNLRGELIAEPNFEHISYAGEGLFRVERGNKIGYFDMEGDWIWDLKD